MYYGPLELTTIVPIPVKTKAYDVDMRVRARIPVVAILRSDNDNDEPYITKVDKLLCLLDDIAHAGGDEAAEVIDILNKLCKPK